MSGDWPCLACRGEGGFWDRDGSTMCLACDCTGKSQADDPRAEAIEDLARKCEEIGAPRAAALLRAEALNRFQSEMADE